MTECEEIELKPWRVWYDRCQVVLRHLDPESTAAEFIGSIAASILADPDRYPTRRQRFWIDQYAGPRLRLVGRRGGGAV